MFEDFVGVVLVGVFDFVWDIFNICFGWMLFDFKLFYCFSWLIDILYVFVILYSEFLFFIVYVFVVVDVLFVILNSDIRIKLNVIIVFFM